MVACWKHSRPKNTERDSTQLYPRNRTTQMYPINRSSTQLFPRHITTQMYQRNISSTQSFPRNTTMQIYPRNRASIQLYPGNRSSTQLFPRNIASTKLNPRNDLQSRLHDDLDPDIKFTTTSFDYRDQQKVFVQLSSFNSLLFHSLFYINLVPFFFSLSQNLFQTAILCHKFQILLNVCLIQHILATYFHP